MKEPIDEMSRLMELWNMSGDPAELHPDLQDCLYEEEGSFSLIKHRLVNTIYSGPQEHNRLNVMLEQKVKACDEYKREGKWESYLNVVERPWRPDALVELSGSMNAVEFAQCLSFVHTDTEVVHQCADEWSALWSIYAYQPEPEHLMDSDEHKKWLAIPEYTTVYRGAHKLEGIAYPMGRCWSTNQERAKWFGNRFTNKDNRVFKRIVRKEHILACFDGRGEDEVVLSRAGLNLMVKKS